MPPSYRALALRMWLSSVVFPAPRKPVRMVTGTRPSSFGSTSIGAIGEVVRHAGGCRDWRAEVGSGAVPADVENTSSKGRVQGHGHFPRRMEVLWGG